MCLCVHVHTCCTLSPYNHILVHACTGTCTYSSTLCTCTVHVHINTHCSLTCTCTCTSSFPYPPPVDDDVQSLNETIQHNLLLGMRPKSVPPHFQGKFLWPNRVRHCSYRWFMTKYTYMYMYIMCTLYTCLVQPL